MTTRKLRNPNARLQGIGVKPTEVQLKEIRDVLVDLWSLVSPSYSSTSVSLTTSGAVAHEIVVCANTIPIVVTLHAGPKDGDAVTVKRTDAQVTITPSGKNIDGEASQILSAQYDGAHMVYTDAAGEWSFV